MIAALNNLEVLLSTDIHNLSAPVHPDEKYWIRAGTEFGSNKDRPAKMMVISLYGLKSSGARLRTLLASTIGALGFKRSKTDPDGHVDETIRETGWQY
jgi:hypothetical protein